MTAARPDAELVAAHLGGDADALAGMYDRYADALHDTAAAMMSDRQEAADVTHDVFLVAAQRLGQLRDPSRLKPWLFAILRNEVYRRTSTRRRTAPTDFSSSGIDMADDRQVDAEADAIAGEELANLVRTAARGLDERDQLLLELSVRQGLEGQDLADALGVSANKSYTLVHRMRARIERSLGALCVATTGRDDCDELDTILAAWDGEFSVLIHKRVARHIDRCDICAHNRAQVAPLALYAAAPLIAAPARLREQVLSAARAVAPAYGFTADGGFLRVARPGWRVAAWVGPTAAASTLLVAAAAGYAWLGDDDPPDDAEAAVTTTLAPPTTPPARTTTTTPGTTTIAVTTTTGPAVIAVVTLPTTTTTTTTTTAPPAAAPGTVRVTTPPPAPPPTPASTSTTTTTTTTTTSTTGTTTTTLPPGRLTATSSRMVDLGSTGTSGAVTITNDGGQPIAWALSGDVGPFVVQPTSGTPAPGQTVDVVASLPLDRGTAPEGDLRAGVAPDGTPGGLEIVPTVGDAVPISVTASVERKPVLDPKVPQRGAVYTCSAWTDIFARVEILEELGVSSAVFEYTDPAGAFTSVALSDSGSSNPGPGGGTYHVWTAVTDTPDPIVGAWTFAFRAVDGRGNAGDAGDLFTIVDDGAGAC